MKFILVFIIFFGALAIVYGVHLHLIAQLKPFNINSSSEIIRLKSHLSNNLPKGFKIATLSFLPNKNLEFNDVLINEATSEIYAQVYRYEIGYSHWKYTGKYCNAVKGIAEYEWQIGKGKTIDEIDFTKLYVIAKDIEITDPELKQFIEFKINCKDTISYTISYQNINSIKEVVR